MKRGNIIGMLERNEEQGRPLKRSDRHSALSGAERPSRPLSVPVLFLFCLLHDILAGRAQDPRAIVGNGEYLAAEIAYLLIAFPGRIIGVYAMEARGFGAYKDLHIVGDIVVGIHLGTAMGARC